MKELELKKRLSKDIKESISGSEESDEFEEPFKDLSLVAKNSVFIPDCLRSSQVNL